jgi:2-oxoglutarate ferredoxin oxidoreductase subunit gamma
LRIEIRISGLGGQGVVLAGQILGRAAVFDGKNAVQTQGYGAEARGSAAKSEVVISDGRIGFPMVRQCDILVALSQEAVERNIKDLKEKGILLLDSSTVKDFPETGAKVFKIPATKIAEATCGEKLYANMVMLGALAKITSITSKTSMEKAIDEIVPKKARTLNLRAFEEGVAVQ